VAYLKLHSLYSPRETSVRITNLWPEIKARDISTVTQECYTKDSEVRRTSFVNLNSVKLKGIPSTSEKVQFSLQCNLLKHRTVIAWQPWQFQLVVLRHGNCSLNTWCADKSLARPSAKIRWKRSRLDFLVSRRHPPHCLSSKGPNYQRRLLLISAGLVAVACFLPGRAKDLSASLYKRTLL
jgi:hypothetical protein